MNYQESSLKIFEHLKTLPPQSPTYMKHLLSYSSVLEKLFPKEFDEELKNLKITDLMNDMNLTAGEMVKQVDSFSLNPETRTIEVTLGDDTLASPIVDLRDYIINKLSLEADSQKYLLALSFLARTENFELFQITHALILK